MGKRGGKIVPISGSFINKQHSLKSVDIEFDEEQKKQMLASLQEIIGEEELSPEEAEELIAAISLPPDKQIEKMIIERDDLEKHIDSSLKVGFSADINEVVENKQLLKAMNSTIKMMQKMTVAELQKEVDRVTEMMSSSHVGFTAKPFAASEIREYVKELEAKMDHIARMDPANNPPYPPDVLFER